MHRTRLKIAGRFWSVRFADLGSELDGECIPREHEITINPNQPSKDLASTFLHEVLHAADPALSEKRVRALEDALFPILWRDGWRPSILLRRGRRRK